MQTNLHFNFNKQCYGRTLYSKLHAFAKKDRRRYVATLKLGPVSLTKKANVPTLSKGTRSNLPLRGWISPSNPHPLPALPPMGFTLIGALHLTPYINYVCMHYCLAFEVLLFGFFSILRMVCITYVLGYTEIFSFSEYSCLSRVFLGVMEAIYCWLPIKLFCCVCGYS